ncbi:MAG: Hpt domain-containing protein [Pirellulales bacterium]
MISDDAPHDSTSGEEPNLSMVDWAVALENTYDDLDLLKELIQGYLQESVKLLKGMHTSIENRDAATLRRSAHTMKSQFRIFGVDTCEHVALDIENMGRDGRVDAEDRVKELERLVDDLEKEMLDFLAGKTSIKSSDDSS